VYDDDNHDRNEPFTYAMWLIATSHMENMQHMVSHHLLKPFIWGTHESCLSCTVGYGILEITQTWLYSTELLSNKLEDCITKPGSLAFA